MPKKMKKVVLQVIPIEFIWIEEAKEVILYGEFIENSTKKIKLDKINGVFRKIIKLKRGKYFYKFIVDDIWRCNPDFPQAVDLDGNLNNIIDISDPDRAFRVIDNNSIKELGNINR